MAAKRTIEIFSAGCPTCEATIARVRELACPSCEIVVLDMQRDDIAERAIALGIRSIPAVVVDGKLADCCAGSGPDEDVLRGAGLGEPLS
jgi:glutaredoxin 3